MIRLVMISLVLMLSFPISGWAVDYTERASGSETVWSIGKIETIDRQKKTKITVNGITYSVSRSIKVKLADRWLRVSNLSVGDSIRFMAKQPKRTQQLPEMISITLLLN